MLFYFLHILVNTPLKVGSFGQGSIIYKIWKFFARFAREVLFLTKSQNLAREKKEVIFLTKSQNFSGAKVLLFTNQLTKSTIFLKKYSFFLHDSFFNKSQSITQFTKSKFCLRNLVPIRWTGLLSLYGPKRAQKRCCSYSFSSVVSNAPFRYSSISMMTVRISSGIYYHKWQIDLLWNCRKK